MAQVSIFVSHSHQDNDWCRSFVAALKAVGYDVWYDETGLTGGAAWVATIQHEVQTRDVFLLVLTSEAWASQWVQDELQLAIATRRRIIPLLLRNTHVDGFVLTTQWVTVVGEEPQVAARAAILAIEAPPAPGRGHTPHAQTETLEDLVTLCQSLLAERRYTEALSACDRALTLDPENIDVLRVQGAALNQIGQRTRAAAVYVHILSRLSPTNADQNQVADYCTFVIEHSANAEDVVQAYHRMYASVGPSRYHPGLLTRVAEVAVPRLVSLEVKAETIIDFLVWLIARYDGWRDNDDGQASDDAFRALATLGQTDILLQLGARLGNEARGIIAMAEVGSIDAVVQQAARVQYIGDRDLVLRVIARRAGLNTESFFGPEKTYCKDIDRICRAWFGYPPSVSTFQADPDDPKDPKSLNFYFHCQDSLRIWAQALEALDGRNEAAVIRNCANQLRR